MIKKGDFVELEYTGALKEDGAIFDTTSEKKAKETGIYRKKMEFGPVIICVGEGEILKGLEEQLIGKEAGKEYTIELSPENGFGKKDAKLIKMIPSNAFIKQNIDPQPGLQVNIDGVLGIIRRTGSGRCLVDFNHPLSGKDVVYKVKINRIVTDDKEKIESFLKLTFRLKSDAYIKDNKAEIKVEKEIPKEIKEAIRKKLIEVIPSIKDIIFIVRKKETAEEQETKK